jgi:hypothetical protein
MGAVGTCGLSPVGLVWVTIALLGQSLGAQDPATSQHSVPSLPAFRTQTPIVVDGRLDEEPWRQAPAASSFRQLDPDEGQPATERTEVHVLYDDGALYVGARLRDTEPGRIVRRLSRRDTEADADSITVYLDPRHDHLTGVSFTLSAAGSRGDAVVFNDSWTDDSWDAVWESAVSVDEQGWTAEIRIPFSQLRFVTQDHQTWGFNLSRFVRRKNETDWWVLVPKKESGLASRMGHLVGLDGIPARRHLELLPYATARVQHEATVGPADPFHTVNAGFGGTGVDLKWCLTSNLTLDATVNPDFGQVEVDPAVVNLTAFETYFQEKRPFFIEGSQIFGNFAHNGANSFFGFNRADPSLFYSRRVGRAPQGSADGDFVAEPTATTILGAGKLTGKTARGWSIGLLDGVTAREWARTATGPDRGRVEVEPASNYLVARAWRDVGQRAGFGFIGTSVTRDLRAPALADQLPSRATVGGLDGHVFLDAKRDWVITGGAAGSWVGGSEQAILHLQRASTRYYQRPDASHPHLDPAARSLSGWTGQINLNKNSGTLTVNAALWGVSPGFEANDAGFQSLADRAGSHAAVVWSKPTPDRWTRSRSLVVAKFWTWNFDRDVQDDGVYAFWNATFLNYWRINGNAYHFRRVQDDHLTRGGPSMLSPSGRGLSLGVSSDSRRSVSLSLDSSYSTNEFGGWGTSTELGVTLKPAPSITVSTAPSVNRTHALAQYVDAVEDPAAAPTFGTRYIFSNLDQTEVSMATRVNAIFTPTLSLQLYVQPLLSVGAYRGFKELATPRTFSFLRYGSDVGSIGYDPATEMYSADPDGPGDAPGFTFDNPDFNFKSLRVNAILRWEWRPGSTFYAVWTQQRQDETHPGNFALGRDAGVLFRAPADDVFMVKVAYWLTR